jgi:hypothetical protein
VVIRVYFEGKRHLREAFHEFFRELREIARQRKGAFQCIAGGSRTETIKDFMLGLATHPNQHVVLLIDCEGPTESCSLEAIRMQNSSIWKIPSGQTVGDGQVFRMIQTMESWFLADCETLNKYYGQTFVENALSRHARIEDTPKLDVLNGLKAATRQTTKGTYKKGSHDKDILRKLDPARVQAACPECNRMFAALRGVLTGP